MDEWEALRAAQAGELCMACGLCCTGHLFIWVKLKPSELGPAERLGMQVSRSDPTQRGFSQPCPLWKGLCTIHETPQYPRACRAYRCKLLKQLMAEEVTLPEAHAVVGQAQAMIASLDAVLPPSGSTNFRERVVALVEHPGQVGQSGAVEAALSEQAAAMLRFFTDNFGVTDFLE
jgi:uncharacterized protein